MVIVMVIFVSAVVIIIVEWPDYALVIAKGISITYIANQLCAKPKVFR